MERSFVRRSPFVLYLTLLFLAIALAGFSTTLFIPLARGTFSAPPVVRVHGVLLFGWIFLMVAQAALVQSRRVAIHRKLGWFGAGLALAIAISGVLVGAFAAYRDVAANGGPIVLGSFFNTVLEMILFGSLIGAAIVNRKRPEVHKRLLIIATISILGPAWLRFRHFMPFVPKPFVTFSYVADAVMLVPIVREWGLFGKVHPVYIWVGGGVALLHAFELLVMESAPWARAGALLLGIAAG